MLTVAGRVDEGSQRLMEHQAMLLDARGVPVVRLDLDGDGIAATGRYSALPSAAQAAARRGDWEGLARQLAQLLVRAGSPRLTQSNGVDGVK